jgi:hypothetical protein
MRIAPIIAGSVIAASLTLVLAASLAETKVVDGQPRDVVPLVRRGRVFERPFDTHCKWVSVPAAVAGAGIGYFASNGGSLGAAFLGALIFGGLSAGWRAEWEDHFGRPGKNAQVSDSWLNGLAGGLIGAAAAAHLAKHQQPYPRRLPPPELSDVV